MKTISRQIYKGIWPVMVTPYKDDLKIDLDTYKLMLEWYLSFRIGGVYANCGSSEMFELNDEEKLLLVAETVKFAAGKVPVAATGNFGENIDEHITFIKKIADTGVDIVMLTVPIFHNNDDELEKYYLTIAERTDVRLGIYECPVPRSYNLGINLINKIAETGKYFAYKETSCNLERIKSVYDHIKDSTFALLQANVPYLLKVTKYGIPGSMNIAANWLPDLEVEVFEKGLNKDPKAAELQSMLCAMEMAQRSVHPMGVKYLISKRGVPIKPLTRFPRTLSDEEKYSLDQASSYWFEKNGTLKALNKINHQ